MILLAKTDTFLFIPIQCMAVVMISGRYRKKRRHMTQKNRCSQSHRDTLKMQKNIILKTCIFCWQITDFGISKWRATEQQITRTRTTGTATGGTFTHIPPEKWKNINCKPTEAYDVYANGIVMWEIFTEQEPFESK